MKLSHKIYFGLLLLFIPVISNAQVDPNKMGAWYMYFANGTFGTSKFGFQADAQYRNWNLGGDLEQLLIDGGFTYQPANTKAKISLNYASSTFGVYGDSDESVHENRIFEEILIPNDVSDRVHLKHRFRFEQRFFEGLDMRTRVRYNLFVNIPLNKLKYEKGTIDLAFYNELFLNSRHFVVNEKRLEFFDRNWTYAAIGYMISEKLKVQVGGMVENTNLSSKKQVQLSLHQKF